MTSKFSLVAKQHLPQFNVRDLTLKDLQTLRDDFEKTTTQEDEDLDELDIHAFTELLQRHFAISVQASHDLFHEIDASNNGGIDWDELSTYLLFFKTDEDENDVDDRFENYYDDSSNDDGDDKNDGGDGKNKSHKKSKHHNKDNTIFSKSLRGKEKRLLDITLVKDTTFRHADPTEGSFSPTSGFNHSDQITRILCHPHVNKYFTSSRDGTIRSWSSENFELQSILHYNRNNVWVNDIAFCHGGKRVVAVSSDRTVSFYDCKTESFWKGFSGTLPLGNQNQNNNNNNPTSPKSNSKTNRQSSSLPQSSPVGALTRSFIVPSGLCFPIPAREIDYSRKKRRNMFRSEQDKMEKETAALRYNLGQKSGTSSSRNKNTNNNRNDSDDFSDEDSTKRRDGRSSSRKSAGENGQNKKVFYTQQGGSSSGEHVQYQSSKSGGKNNVTGASVRPMESEYIILNDLKCSAMSVVPCERSDRDGPILLGLENGTVQAYSFEDANVLRNPLNAKQIWDSNSLFNSNNNNYTSNTFCSPSSSTNARFSNGGGNNNTSFVSALAHDPHLDCAFAGGSDGRIFALSLRESKTTEITRAASLIASSGGGGAASLLVSSGLDSVSSTLPSSSLATMRAIYRLQSLSEYRLLMSCGSERCVKLWSPTSGLMPPIVLESPGGIVVDACQMKNEPIIVTLDTEKVIKLWDLRTQRIVNQWVDSDSYRPHNTLSAVATDYKRQRIVTGLTAPVVHHLTRALVPFPEPWYKGHQKPIVRVIRAPHLFHQHKHNDNENNNNNNHNHQHDSSSKHPHLDKKEKSASSSSMEVEHKKEGRIVTACEECVKVWNVSDGTLHATWTIPQLRNTAVTSGTSGDSTTLVPGVITSITFDNTGRRLFILTSNGCCFIVNFCNGLLLRELSPLKGPNTNKGVVVTTTTAATANKNKKKNGSSKNKRGDGNDAANDDDDDDNDDNESRHHKNENTITDLTPPPKSQHYQHISNSAQNVARQQLHRNNNASSSVIGSYSQSHECVQMQTLECSGERFVGCLQENHLLLWNDAQDGIAMDKKVDFILNVSLNYETFCRLQPFREQGKVHISEMSKDQLVREKRLWRNTMPTCLCSCPPLYIAVGTDAGVVLLFMLVPRFHLFRILGTVERTITVHSVTYSSRYDLLFAAMSDGRLAVYSIADRSICWSLDHREPLAKRVPQLKSVSVLDRYVATTDTEGYVYFWSFYDNEEDDGDEDNSNDENNNMDEENSSSDFQPSKSRIVFQRQQEHQRKTEQFLASRKSSDNSPSATTLYSQAQNIRRHTLSSIFHVNSEQSFARIIDAKEAATNSIKTFLPSTCHIQSEVTFIGALRAHADEAICCQLYYYLPPAIPKKHPNLHRHDQENNNNTGDDEDVDDPRFVTKLAPRSLFCATAGSSDCQCRVFDVFTGFFVGFCGNSREIWTPHARREEFLMKKKDFRRRSISGDHVATAILMNLEKTNEVDDKSPHQNEEEKLFRQASQKFLSMTDEKKDEIQNKTNEDSADHVPKEMDGISFADEADFFEDESMHHHLAVVDERSHDEIDKVKNSSSATHDSKDENHEGIQPEIFEDISAISKDRVKKLTNADYILSPLDKNDPGVDYYQLLSENFALLTRSMRNGMNPLMGSAVFDPIALANVTPGAFTTTASLHFATAPNFLPRLNNNNNNTNDQSFSARKENPAFVSSTRYRQQVADQKVYEEKEQKQKEEKQKQLLLSEQQQQQQQPVRRTNSMLHSSRVTVQNNNNNNNNPSNASLSPTPVVSTASPLTKLVASVATPQISSTFAIPLEQAHHNNHNQNKSVKFFETNEFEPDVHEIRQINNNNISPSASTSNYSTINLNLNKSILKANFTGKGGDSALDASMTFGASSNGTAMSFDVENLIKTKQLKAKMKNTGGGGGATDATSTHSEKPSLPPSPPPLLSNIGKTTESSIVKTQLLLGLRKQKKQEQELKAKENNIKVKQHAEAEHEKLRDNQHKNANAKNMTTATVGSSPLVDELLEMSGRHNSQPQKQHQQHVPPVVLSVKPRGSPERDDDGDGDDHEQQNSKKKTPSSTSFESPMSPLCSGTTNGSAMSSPQKTPRHNHHSDDRNENNINNLPIPTMFSLNPHSSVLHQHQKQIERQEKRKLQQQRTTRIIATTSTKKQNDDDDDDDDEDLRNFLPAIQTTTRTSYHDQQHDNNSARQNPFFFYNSKGSLTSRQNNTKTISILSSSKSPYLDFYANKKIMNSENRNQNEHLSAVEIARNGVRALFFGHHLHHQISNGTTHSVSPSLVHGGRISSQLTNPSSLLLFTPSSPSTSRLSSTTNKNGSDERQQRKDEISARRAQKRNEEYQDLQSRIQEWNLDKQIHKLTQFISSTPNTQTTTLRGNSPLENPSTVEGTNNHLQDTSPPELDDLAEKQRKIGAHRRMAAYLPPLDTELRDERINQVRQAKKLGISDVAEKGARPRMDLIDQELARVRSEKIVLHTATGVVTTARAKKSNNIIIQQQPQGK